MSLQKQQMHSEAKQQAIQVIKARLKAERVQDMLDEVPGWQLQPGALGLDRVRSFPDSEIALSYAAFAEKLARHSKLTLAAQVTGGHLFLTVHNVGARGRINPINRVVFALAKQLG
jgi:hypothetical protein